MSKYKRDEINFHSFLNMIRQHYGITLERICEGLCSVSMMKRIESGERLPEKQMRDRILGRIGVSLEGYEDYLSFEEYEQWELRQRILECIEIKDIQGIKRNLTAYKIYECQNLVEAQYCKTIEYIILQLENTDKEEQKRVLKHAIEFTVPDMERSVYEKKLLSVQEINLLIEYVRICEYNDEEEEYAWKYNKYQEILNYIEQSYLDNFCRAKVYPKAAYYLGELILHKKEEVLFGIHICCKSIELLQNSKKLYYFVEISETLEKLLQMYEDMLKEVQKKNFFVHIKDILEFQSVIKELYRENDVCPYMQNFNYLYWETESYCIGDVIRIRRKMYGLTKEKLCEGICSIKTLTRVERKKVKTQMVIVRELFQRLGLCAEYIRARVITSDYEVLMLAEKCAYLENDCRFDEWEKTLIRLEQSLCMEIVQNKQFVEHSYLLLKLKKGELAIEDFIEKMIEIVEYSIPIEYIMKSEKIFLSREEITYFYTVGMHTIHNEDNSYMQKIKDYCTEYKTDAEIVSHIRRYEFMMLGVISYLGNIGQYAESNEFAIRLLKKSLMCRRALFLPDIVYNILWNNQKRLQTKICEEKKMLENCFIMSSYLKRKELTIFFEKKWKFYLD